MSKPEPPKKIDPLPVPPPKAGDAKPAAAKKTGWEPPSPQKQHALERKLGILLAVCLLVALGFVASRKFDANRNATPVAKKFTAPGEQLPAPDGKSQLTPNVPADTLPLVDLSQHTGAPTAEFSTTSTAAEMTFENAPPPDQSEPGTELAHTETSSSPTFEFMPSETPAQPETSAADESSNPFFTAETAVESGNDAVEASDPFATDSTTTTDSEIAASDSSAFSSDESSQFGAAADPVGAAPDAGLTFSEPPVQSEPESAVPEEASSTPVVGLFGIEAAEEATQVPETETTTPATTSSPWGGTEVAQDAGDTTDATDANTLAESEPPQLLEPNDPQVMPTLTLGPFGPTSPDPASEPQPATVESTPLQPAGQGAVTFPDATVEMRVQQRPSIETPAENPFSSGSATTVVERSSNSMADPFAPAHDVSHAIREDEVVMHVVQTGDNFWGIAKQHYGSGKYFTALAAYNQSLIPDPRRIRPGMKVQVPSEVVLAQQFPQLVSGSSATPYAAPPSGPPGFSIDSHGHPQFRIAKGDTLSSIAEKHLGRASRWRQIFGMNMDQLTSADSLTTGMVLRLPSDATQIRMDAAGMPRR